MSELIFSGITIDQFRAELSAAVQKEIAPLVAKLSGNDRTELLTRKEVASLLHLSLSTLNEYTKQGRIPARRVGRRVLYNYSEVMSAGKKIKTSPAL